jgi:hypothetical protein
MSYQEKFSPLPLDILTNTWYNIRMKTLILLALAVTFNDFIGSLIALIGSLMVRIGHSITLIPELF